MKNINDLGDQSPKKSNKNLIIGMLVAAVAVGGVMYFSSNADLFKGCIGRGCIDRGTSLITRGFKPKAANNTLAYDLIKKQYMQKCGNGCTDSGFENSVKYSAMVASDLARLHFTSSTEQIDKNDVRSVLNGLYFGITNDQDAAVVAEYILWESVKIDQKFNINLAEQNASEAKKAMGNIGFIGGIEFMNSDWFLKNGLTNDKAFKGGTGSQLGQGGVPSGAAEMKKSNTPGAAKAASLLGFSCANTASSGNGVKNAGGGSVRPGSSMNSSFGPGNDPWSQPNEPGSNTNGPDVSGASVCDVDSAKLNGDGTKGKEQSQVIGKQQYSGSGEGSDGNNYQITGTTYHIEGPSGSYYRHETTVTGNGKEQLVVTVSDSKYNPDEVKIPSPSKSGEQVIIESDAKTEKNSQEGSLANTAMGDPNSDSSNNSPAQQCENQKQSQASRCVIDSIQGMGGDSNAGNPTCNALDVYGTPGAGSPTCQAYSAEALNLELFEKMGGTFMDPKTTNPGVQMNDNQSWLMGGQGENSGGGK